MSNEEALKETLRRKEIAEMTAEKEVVEYYGIVAEAIEKRISKNPYYEGDRHSNGEIVYDTWICCPSCGAKYTLESDRFRYCMDCGQAIDFTVEK